MAETNRKPRRRPRTGDARETKQPLKIDRLPDAAKDAILVLRNRLILSWEEIEERSARKYSAEWLTDGGGFVNWDDVPVSVLEAFPDLRLPHSTLHRWYDLRFSQVRRDVLIRSKQAQEIAEAFTRANLVNDEQGVINAARDTLMGILAEDRTNREGAAKGLIKLGELMQKARTNDIRERKVSVEEQTLQLKLDEMKRKAGDLVKAIEGDGEGAQPASREEMLQRAKEIYGVV